MSTVTVQLRTLVAFATGVAVAVIGVVVFQAWRVDAAPGDSDTTFVPIAPCRLIDTRPAPDRVGPHGTSSADNTTTVQAHGTNGDCTIPTDAAGLSLNVTALNATEPTFLTIWPDGARPVVSSVNPVPGQPPTPNAVATDLSGAGAFNIYNLAGTVDVIVDVNGYYTKTSLQQLAQRLASVEAAQAAGVDPAVLARLDAVESDTAANTADVATVEAGVATNAAGVAALDAAQPFTVVSNPIQFVIAGSTPTEIRSVTVTAPVDGRVATAASGSMNEGTEGQFVECGLMDSVANPPPVGEQLFWQSPTGGNSAHLSATRVFDIAAGQTATYSLVCSNNSSGGSSTIRSPRVMAIFTPAA